MMKTQTLNAQINGRKSEKGEYNVFKYYGIINNKKRTKGELRNTVFCCANCGL